MMWKRSDFVKSCAETSPVAVIWSFLSGVAYPMLCSSLGQIRTDRDIDSEVNVDRDIRHGGKR